MSIHITGSGTPALLFVPGGPALPLDFYRELLDDLRRSYRVITYDMQGVWPEPPEPFPHTVRATADELIAAAAEVRDELGDAPLVIFGHSFGAVIALDALCRGVGADAAVLVSGFSSGAMIKRDIGERVKRLPGEFHEAYRSLEPSDAQGLMQLLMEYWFPRHLVRTAWPDSFSEALGKMNGAYSQHFLGPNLLDPSGEILNWDRTGDLASVLLPVKLIFGEHDYYTPQDVEAMAAALPRSDVTVIPEASHSQWLETPVRFHGELSSFFQDENLM
jgi:proline-specific peptidase